MNPPPMTMTRYVCAALAILVATALLPARASAQDRLPYQLDQIVRLLDSGVFSDARILQLAREACVAFEVDQEAESELRAAGASGTLISGLRGVCKKLPRRVAGLRVSPRQVELDVGSIRVLKAEALDADSTVVPGVPVEWSAEDTAVAQVSMGGTVEAKSAGTTRIVARVEDGPEAAVRIRVPGEGVPAMSGDGAPERRSAGGKSPATAAAIGAIVPGGGEFYVGNTMKGGVVLLGSAAAVAAGLLITDTDTAIVSSTLSSAPSGECSSCQYSFELEGVEEETNQIVIGAAVAGAFWAFGLIDGILSAGRSGSAESSIARHARPGTLTVTLAPTDGVRARPGGRVDFTFVRIGL